MIHNTFYNEFDRETYEGRSTKDYRTEFERDRDRIIYCAAFRRLQGKTQVFMSGDYDFYRTRLTHSIEVSQIGRSIVNFVNQHSEFFADSYYLDPVLVEVVSLAHDIGHPPFGHGGEKVLNELMAQYGGFEGNAQTLRILTEIFYDARAGRQGMKPTRALMDGVMKYKNLEKETREPKRKFLYNDQQRYLDYVSAAGEYTPALSHQSIECQIMDWADDTAYSVNDLLDGYKAGFLTQRSIENWAGGRQLTDHQTRIITNLIDHIVTEADVEIYLANKVGEFIQSVAIEQIAESQWSDRYNYELRPGTEYQVESQLYKDLAFDVIFQSPQIQQLEAKGGRIIRSLFTALADRYLHRKNTYELLPAKVAHQIKQAPSEQEQARLLCDHIAGMTDRYAIRIYKRIFDPEFGSIVDLI
ncbi:MAG TPA: dNTP triphosphohydrolase [bacterium]|nr:dNTP triphosphohydrolase [bacterium]